MPKYTLLLTMVFVLVSTLLPTTAQSAIFHQNDQVVIKSGISFVWLRNQPTSNCACVEYEITSPKRVLRVLDAKPTSDGMQNWWHVSTITRPIKQGWVEEKSLTLLKPAPTVTTTPNRTQLARQFLTNAVKIRAGIPFIWIRNAPSSTAAILQTVKFSAPIDSSQCLTLETVGTVLRWNGQQWWRTLIPSVGARSDIKAGWVEENSLVDCNPNAPVSTATVTPSLSSSSFITPFPPVSTYAAYQPYENGIMIWRQDDQSVYVLSNKGSFVVYTVNDYSSLASPTDVPTAGRYTPVNAFGKVWNGEQFRDTSVRDVMGWATAPELGYTAAISAYSNGCLGKCDINTKISLPNGRTAELSTAFYTWKFN